MWQKLWLKFNNDKLTIPNSTFCHAIHTQNRWLVQQAYTASWRFLWLERTDVKAEHSIYHIYVVKLWYTHMVMFKKRDNNVSLQMAQLMKRLSLNSDGAFQTTIQRRMPHRSRHNSAEIMRKVETLVTYCETYMRQCQPFKLPL